MGGMHTSYVKIVKRLFRLWTFYFPEYRVLSGI